jgi:nitrite reductase/ring-hydroxylating ferredoxin subunit
MAERLRRDGALVFEQTRVTSIDERADGCTVRTESGLELTAGAVVQTTHLPVVDPALLASRVTPHRSYALAAPMDAPPAGMYLAVDGGWSIRPWLGGAEPMVIVGGEGHAMTRDVETARRYEALAGWAHQRLGVTAVQQWSAFDYATTDGLPFIGRLTPRSSRRYVATGFHKWGISTSMAAAVIISDALAGRANPYAATFDSTRLVATVTRDLAGAAAGVANHWLGDRLRARRDVDVSALAPGEARTLRRGMTTIVVAKDDAGVVHAVEAACTHLGCVVGFNAGEQTWDCPCHGSRFALDGTVIDGPATTPLTPVDLDAQGATSR